MKAAEDRETIFGNMALEGVEEAVGEDESD
jgi:hypothetical protein